MHTLLTITGSELDSDHYTRLDASSRREFGQELPDKSELRDRLYFLLLAVESGNLLASAYLKPIHPVIFQGETFSFLNIGGVIADEKGRGYGKQVMLAMRAYLLANDQTGLGFCFPKNQGFYEKCGFAVEANATPRFIYRDGDGQEFTAEGQYILYLESSERLMERVLAGGGAEVYVPDPGIW